MGLFRYIKTLFRIWNTKNLLRNIRFLLEHDLNNSLDETIESCAYELDEIKAILLSRKPRVLTVQESLKLLLTQPKSFARFGDGEISIMKGNNLQFQSYDPQLAMRLLQVLKTKRNDLYVGINDNYFHAIPPDAPKQKREFLRKYSPSLRDFFIRETNPEIQYLNACCLIGYFDYCDDDIYSEFIKAKRRLFEGKKITVVTGKSVIEKLDYDIFELAASKKYIEAPSKNAFQEYTSIIDNIKRDVSKDDLICLILGPTATVMASDLTDLGYMAWDVGHIAKDYDAFMKKLDRNSEKAITFWVAD
ncbi:MAG: DUF1792 domain-containing protein [Synergistaceae bacterium]|nr:DUF1792 domain-containing protein [Synergistaceae bacterium]